MPQMGAQRVGTNLTQVTGPDAEEDDDPNRLPTFVKAHAQHRSAQNTLNTSVTETYSYRNNHENEHLRTFEFIINICTYTHIHIKASYYIKALDASQCILPFRDEQCSKPVLVYHYTMGLYMIIL